MFSVPMIVSFMFLCSTYKRFTAHANYQKNYETRITKKSSAIGSESLDWDL